MINRNCILCHYDTTPCSEPPYCKLFHEDYDCKKCSLTDQEKMYFYEKCEKAINDYEKLIKKRRTRKGTER